MQRLWSRRKLLALEAGEEGGRDGSTVSERRIVGEGIKTDTGQAVTASSALTRTWT